MNRSRTGSAHRTLIAALIALAASPAVPLPAQGQKAAAVPSVPTPDLKGERLSVAEQVLRLADLRSRTGIFYIASDNWRDDLKPGVVYMQTPQPKSSVPADGEVAVWTFRKAGKAQKVVAVPDLRGKTAAEAEQALEDVGLTLMGHAKGEAAADRDKVEEPPVAADQYPRARQQVFERTAVYVRFKPKAR